MSALPRPDLAPGPMRSLNDALHELHHRAGWPSLRTLARRTGVSHTTVSKVFSAPVPPSWGTVELVVEALGGDVAHVHGLWLAASGPRAPGGGATRIAGRRAELAVVRRHLELGSGLLLVTGEAGIGKTTLLRSAVGSVDRPVLTAPAYPTMSAEPFAVVGDLLRQAWEVDGGTWFRAALADCPPYVVPALSRILPELDDDGARQDDEHAIARSFAAVRAVVEALADHRPYALVVEDAHWADRTSLTHVERHVSSRSRVPVVATARTHDLAPAASEWLDRARRVAVDRLELEPLTQEETAEQISLMTGVAPTTEHAQRVHRLTGGLPLFVADLAAWIPGTELPRGLADSFDRRLRGLPADARSVVAAVAVAGRPLPAGVVGDVAGLDRLRCIEALRALDEARLLSRPTGDDVNLHHPLLAEAAVALLVPGEAAALHERLARRLAVTDGRSAAEVADHWRWAGVEPEELRWRVRAARVADDRSAAAEACEHWLRVLALWDRRPPDVDVSRAELVLAAISALMHAGRDDEVRPLIAEALAMAPMMPARQRAVAFRRASQNLKENSPDSGVAFARHAQAAFEALGDETGAVLAMCDRSCALRGSGRYEEGREVITAALLRCRALDDPALLRDVLIEKAWHDVVAGRREAGLEAAAEATRVITDTPDPFSEVWTAVYHTDLLLMLGAPSRVVEGAAAGGLASARRSRIESWVLSTTLVANLVEALLADGLVARAGSVIDPVTEGPPVFAHRFLHLARAGVDIARGRLDESADRIARVAAFGTAGLGHLEGQVQTAAACAVWSGRPRQAWELLLERFSRPGPPSWSPYTGTTLVLAARAAADLAADGDDPSGLLADLDRMHAAVEEDPLRVDAPVATASQARALWRAERARLDGADTGTHWQSAVVAADRLHRLHDAAYCRWRAARAALRDGQGTVAGRLLTRAAADAREHVPLSRAIAATRAAS